MKRAIIIIMLLSVCILSGCAAPASKVISPEETVKRYFTEFNNKNQSGMDALVYKKMRGGDYDLNNLNSVKLISCTEEKDASKVSINKEWYSNPYKTALVYAEFDINYNNRGNNGGLKNGRYHYGYYLVKESEKSDWIIVQGGVA